MQHFSIACVLEFVSFWFRVSLFAAFFCCSILLLHVFCMSLVLHRFFVCSIFLSQHFVVGCVLCVFVSASFLCLQHFSVAAFCGCMCLCVFGSASFMYLQCLAARLPLSVTINNIHTVNCGLLGYLSHVDVSYFWSVKKIEKKTTSNTEPNLKL